MVLPMFYGEAVVMLHENAVNRPRRSFGHFGVDVPRMEDHGTGPTDDAQQGPSTAHKWISGLSQGDPAPLELAQAGSCRVLRLISVLTVMISYICIT